MIANLRLLSYAECAALAGRSTKTIGRWAKLGLFPVTKVNGRPQVREAYFRKAIERHTSPLLTAIAVEYGTGGGFAVEQIVPRRTVANREFKYGVWDLGKYTSVDGDA